MTTEAATSEPVDPLSGLCGPSLFPRTVRASIDAPLSSIPIDLDSIHSFMKSLKSGPRSPEKLLAETKSIVDGSSELLQNSNLAAFTMSIGINDAGLARDHEKPRERRPAIGRKKPRFSLKPNSSQPSESLEPSLNIDQLQDPEEFFKAFERLENAKKEIQRQKGDSIPFMDETNLSQNTRRRRPTLSRKSVTYKHRYPLVSSENDDTFMPSQSSENQDTFMPSQSSENQDTFIPSQDPLVLKVPSEPNFALQETDDSDVESLDVDVAGSISKTDNKVNKILDELLSSNINDLDGDGAVSLLQKRLQIKPIELSTLNLPDFHDIGRTDFMALGKNLTKPRRTSLEVQSLVKRTSKETPVSHKQMEASPLASPTPPKSPFAQLSLLNKRILQSNPSTDPFSPLNVDLSTPRNLSSVNQVGSSLDEVNGQKRFNISENLKSLTEDEITELEVSDRASEKLITGSSDGLPDQSPSEDGITKLEVSNKAEKVIMGGSGNLDDQSMDKHASRQSPYVDVTPNRSHNNSAVHHDGNNMGGTSYGNIENSDLMDGLDMTKVNVEDGPNPSQVVSSLKEHDGADCSTKSASATNGQGSRQMEKNVEDMPSAAVSAHVDINIEKSTIPENLNGDQKVVDESHPATTKECTIDKPPTLPESNSKQKTKKLSPTNVQPKRKRSAVERRESKYLSRRQSIADGGTSFESGVRRSKRIKSRPLEYWKGERFVYGRVNGGVKLIGLKYFSPSKGEEEPKVKPYVSNEYNELLELAAKH